MTSHCPSGISMRLSRTCKVRRLSTQAVSAENLFTRQLMREESHSTHHTILMGSVLVGMAQFYATRVFSLWPLARNHKREMLSFFSPLGGIQMGMLPCLMGNNGYQTISKTAYTLPHPIKTVRLMSFTGDLKYAK